MKTTFQNFFQELIQYGLEYFGLFYSSYRGTVADNRDPEMLGRLKVRCSALYGDDVPPYWAWPKAPFAGNQIGFFAIPEIGDALYIECEGGNPKFPIWNGGWWSKPSSASKVPEVARLSPPTNRVWQTTSGHRIELDDTPGSEKIKITDKSGNYILIDSNTRNKEEIVGGAWNITVTGIATIIAPNIILNDGAITPDGVITGMSICHFTGLPHGDKSATVKASKP